MYYDLQDYILLGAVLLMITLILLAIAMQIYEWNRSTDDMINTIRTTYKSCVIYKIPQHRDTVYLIKDSNNTLMEIQFSTPFSNKISSARPYIDVNILYPAKPVESN